MTHISRFDPSRETAGAIYRKAQINGERGVIVGDVNHEIVKDLVDDINENANIGRKLCEHKVFYLALYEKMDLAMRKGLARIPKITPKRPYPEQDSMVFKVYPDEIYFCWELPHRSHMINELACPELFPEDRLQLYRHWENLRLEYFGFRKTEDGNWEANPFYQGDKLISNKPDDIKVAVTKA